MWSALAGTATMSGGERLTVLVTDDHADCRELYRHWLGDRHEVREAANGEEALERLDATVDVVLLDREMPGPSGIEVARRIAAGEYEPHVVMISSAPIDLDLAELPVHDYVRKPVDGADLEEILEEYRARQDYEAALSEFFSITATVASLEAEHAPETLAGNERYERLKWLVDEKRFEVDRALAERDPDLTGAFRDFKPAAVADPRSRPV